MDDKQQEAANLVEIMGRFLNVWESEYRRRTALRSMWAKGAEYIKYRSVSNLVEWLADNPDGLTTEQMTGLALASQLKEYYGGNLVDSTCLRPDNYFERLMLHDFDAEPEGRFTISKYAEDNVYYDLTLSGYHYLKDRLKYLPAWNTLFYEVFLPSMDEKYGKKVALSDAITEFPKWLKSLGFDIASSDDPYKDYVGGGYTYNYDSRLNQSFTYETFYVDGVPEAFEAALGDMQGEYITIIQIHIGADARWGFSDPVLYQCDPYLPYNVADGTVHCDKCHAWWDASFSWSTKLYNDELPDLEDFPVREVGEDDEQEEVEPEIVAAPSIPLPGFEELTRKVSSKKNDIDPELHPIYIDEDGNATCPMCGEGRLTAALPYADWS